MPCNARVREGSRSLCNKTLKLGGELKLHHIIDINEFCAYACGGNVLLAATLDVGIIFSHTIGLISGCGTASNLWYCSFRSGPILIYAPLFSVVSQYFGAEKTVPLLLVSPTPCMPYSPPRRAEFINR